MGNEAGQLYKVNSLNLKANLHCSPYRSDPESSLEGRDLRTDEQTYPEDN